jgi:hypothetical protein
VWAFYATSEEVEALVQSLADTVAAEASLKAALLDVCRHYHHHHHHPHHQEIAALKSAGTRKGHSRRYKSKKVINESYCLRSYFHFVYTSDVMSDFALTCLILTQNRNIMVNALNFGLSSYF